ncbi:MAG: hypothetical protein ACI4KL_04760 [Lentihominibacter sp.]
MLRNKKVLMLISLLVAIGVWIYVMGNVDPLVSERIDGVKVELQGEDTLKQAGLKATLKDPKRVSVTIEGKRSHVNKVKKKGVEAYVDVSTCDYGRNEGKIVIELPDTVTGVLVENISSKTAVFTVK